MNEIQNENETMKLKNEKKIRFENFNGIILLIKVNIKSSAIAWY